MAERTLGLALNPPAVRVRGQAVWGRWLVTFIFLTGEGSASLLVECRADLLLLRAVSSLPASGVLCLERLQENPSAGISAGSRP